MQGSRYNISQNPVPLFGLPGPYITHDAQAAQSDPDRHDSNTIRGSKVCQHEGTCNDSMIQFSKKGPTPQIIVLTVDGY